MPFMPPSSGPKVLEARGIGTTSSNLGTPSQPSVGMASPAEIDGLGGTEPTEWKSEGARLGRVHSEPPLALLDRHGRQGAIRLITFFVHVSPAEGYGYAGGAAAAAKKSISRSLTRSASS